MGDNTVKVLVAGATGETGSRVVTQLLKRGISAKALVRDVAIAQAKLPSEVELCRARWATKPACKRP